MRLIDYFERVYIIHLPERLDRYQSLSRELAAVGIDIKGAKVNLLDPPRSIALNGFPSLGVHSNFLSHLGILKECLKDGIERVWILEDDAIFRRQLRQEQEQEKLIKQLAKADWDLCYLGHAIEPKALRAYPTGLVPFKGDFIWAHCYCVHARVLPQLVHYLEETLLNPPGHPRGGRLYLDGAFNLFRRLHPDVVCLVSHPNLSSQKGSPSNLANRSWYDQSPAFKPLVTAGRSLRDELWRFNG